MKSSKFLRFDFNIIGKQLRLDGELKMDNALKFSKILSMEDIPRVAKTGFLAVTFCYFAKDQLMDVAKNLFG